MTVSRARFHPRKAWGQNFLVNEGAADTIVRAFRPRPDDLVVEVGPGRGALTRRLAGRVARLAAIEIDPALTAPLREELGADPSVEILQADVLALDLRALLDRLGASTVRPARVIANLPYSVATAVILRCVEERRIVSDLLVLVQREVAQRIVSPPGRKTYGGLSVLCQSRARVEVLLRLRPGSFRPVPKVESELVRLTLHRGEAGADDDRGGVPLENLLRVAFQQRRKTLLNNLARWPGPSGGALGPEAADSVIRRAGLDPGARPETIPVEGFLALRRALAAL